MNPEIHCHRILTSQVIRRIDFTYVRGNPPIQIDHLAFYGIAELIRSRQIQIRTNVPTSSGASYSGRARDGSAPPRINLEPPRINSNFVRIALVHEVVHAMFDMYGWSPSRNERSIAEEESLGVLAACAYMIASGRRPEDTTYGDPAFARDMRSLARDGYCSNPDVWGIGMRLAYRHHLARGHRSPARLTSSDIAPLVRAFDDSCQYQFRRGRPPAGHENDFEWRWDPDGEAYGHSGLQ